MLHSYQLSDMQFLRSHSEQQITNNALVLFSIFFYFLLLSFTFNWTFLTHSAKTDESSTLYSYH